MAQYPDRAMYELDGTWKYMKDAGDVDIDSIVSASYDRSEWQSIEVPSNWYLTEIGDYDGAVWFSRTFDADLDRGPLYTLEFLAVDYIAEVWLNGSYVGSHEGYFTPFSFRVENLLKPKQNELLVKVISPRDPTEYVLVEDPDNLSTPMSTPYKRHWAKDLTIIKGHLIDAMHRPGSMTKYRQDGNTGGIWQSVRLVAHDTVTIDYTKIYTKIVNRDFIPDGTALVSVDVEMTNHTQSVQKVNVEFTIVPASFSADCNLVRTRALELQPGKQSCKLVQTVPDAQLWWTWDHGKPNLYQATFCIHSADGELMDCSTEPFGIKEVVHEEATGQWYLNGKKIFLRGMRYYSSMFMSEITKPRVEKDLKDMLDMDINSIRIGSHVELDLFYTLCDEMGFLVWQNFPLHYCYSDSDELIERASVMMRDMVRMLHNHASLGMWSVFKEPQIYALPDMPNNYGRLCEILYETGKTVDPIRWMHKGDYQEGVQNLMTGCCQPGDLDMKRIRIEPNIVEFGSHALPSLETMKKIIPEKDLWPPNWDVWEYWGFFYDLQVRHTKLDLAVGSLEELIDQSQRIEARTIKEQIEFLRQRKYAPVASMYLYYWNDPVAMIGSGIVDYFGKKLPAYHSMKQVYTPVMVSLEWNKDPYIIGYDKYWKAKDLFLGKIWVVNDHSEALPVTVSWSLKHTDSNLEHVTGSMDVVLAPDSSKVVATVSWQVEGTSGPHSIEMKVVSREGEVLSFNNFDFLVN